MVVLLKSRIIRLVAIMIAVLIVITGCSSSDSGNGSEIEFTGDIQTINGNILTVGGFTVDTSDASIPIDGLDTGVTVVVIGSMQEQTVIATSVVIVTDEPQVAATEASDPTEESTEASEESTEPSEESTEAPLPDDDSMIIVIEGPVEEININYIVIFGMQIQVDPSDEILTQITIGDVIKVEGTTVIEGDVIIIVAVNLTIINTTIIVIDGGSYAPAPLPANCRVKKSGKVTCKNTRRTRRTNR